MSRHSHSNQPNNRFRLRPEEANGVQSLDLSPEDNDIVQNLLKNRTVSYATAWLNVDMHITYLLVKGDYVLQAKGYQTLLKESQSPLFKSVFLVSLLERAYFGDHPWRVKLVQILANETSLDMSLCCRKFKQLPGTARNKEFVRVTFVGNAGMVLKASGMLEKKGRLSPSEIAMVLGNRKLMTNISIWGKEVYRESYSFLFDKSMQERDKNVANHLLEVLEKAAFNESIFLTAPFISKRHPTGFAKMYSHDREFNTDLTAAWLAGVLIPQIFYEGNRKCYQNPHLYKKKAIERNVFKKKIFDNFESFMTDEVSQKILSIELIGRLRMLGTEQHYKYWKKVLNRETFLHPVFAFAAYVGNLQLFKILEKFVASCRNLNVADNEAPVELMEVENILASKHPIAFITVTTLYIKAGEMKNLKYQSEYSNHFLFFSSPLIAAIVFGRSEMIEYLLKKLPEEKLALVCSRDWMQKLFLTFREGPCQLHVKKYIRKYQEANPKKLLKELRREHTSTRRRKRRPPMFESIKNIIMLRKKQGRGLLSKI